VKKSSNHPERINVIAGQDRPRRNAIRHAQGRGRFVDDNVFANLAHLAVARSPHAHAEIRSIDLSRALAISGVVAIYTGGDMKGLCKPWVGALDHFPGLRSPEQYPLAVDRVRWNGEPVVAVVAESRAIAEDAVDQIKI
jgi:carbon-monoxide dehydrogenase large subunit